MVITFVVAGKNVGGEEEGSQSAVRPLIKIFPPKKRDAYIFKTLKMIFTTLLQNWCKVISSGKDEIKYLYLV